jgi:hypothetical protein
MSAIDHQKPRLHQKRKSRSQHHSPGMPAEHDARDSLLAATGKRKYETRVYNETKPLQHSVSVISEKERRQTRAHIKKETTSPAASTKPGRLSPCAPFLKLTSWQTSVRSRRLKMLSMQAARLSTSRVRGGSRVRNSLAMNSTTFIVTWALSRRWAMLPHLYERDPV